MAVGRPGVPSWVDAAGDQHHRRPGNPGPADEDAWDGAGSGSVAGTSRMQASLSRTLAYGLWGLIALAVVLGLVNCAGLPGAGSPQATGDDTPPPPVPPPGGCAELVVAAWLAGDTELLADVPGLPRGRPDEARREATRTYTAAATPGDGAWGYLIAADVRVRNDQADDDPEADPWHPVGTQFFRVTMVPTSAGGCQGWRPAALPAQVSPPALAGDPSVPYERPYPVSLPHSGTELSHTLESFFAGMLTGSESLERYVAPGVYIPPLIPPPYQEASVADIRAREELAAPVPADGTVAQLQVTVTTDAGDLPLVYPVTVTVRGGRWEVVSLDPLVGTAVAQLPGGPQPGGTLPSGPLPGTADPGFETTPPADSSNGG